MTAGWCKFDTLMQHGLQTAVIDRLFFFFFGYYSIHQYPRLCAGREDSLSAVIYKHSYLNSY